MTSNAPPTPGGGGTPSSGAPPPARKGSVVAGRKEISDFLVGRLLGEGAFARVHAVRLKNAAAGGDYAMKVMEKAFIKKMGKMKEVQMERRVLSEVAHPFIVRLFFSFHDVERLYMIMDLCQGGELARLIRFRRDKLAPVRRALTEEDARFYLAETVSALQYLHTLGIVHRDVKPENILIAKDGHVKLTDFGTCKDNVVAGPVTSGGAAEKPRKDTFCGTAEYVSPEVLQDAVTGFPSDLWALGIMTFFMLTGRTPFLADSEFLTFQHILAYAGQDEAVQSLTEMNVAFLTPSTLQFPPVGVTAADIPVLTDQSLDLIRRLLHPDPAQRLGAAQPQDLTSHAFFHGMDFKHLETLVPPPLPYPMFEDQPTFDGAKNDWLLLDDDGDGEDLLEELAQANNTPRTTTSSPNRRSGGSSSQAGGAAASASYTSLLRPGEQVMVEGPVTVSSQMGLVSRRRHLILCKGPQPGGEVRFLYIDPASAGLKGEIDALPGQTSVVIRSSGKDFDVVVGKKAFRFRDVMGAPDRWKLALDKAMEGLSLS